MARRATRDGFGQHWLFERLAHLLPDFPAVSLCVALSGGVDSSALLTALATPRRQRPGLRAVHVDHGIHPNSTLWSAHCRALASRLGVPLQVLATRVRRARGESLEAAARAVRYTLLAANLQEGEILLTAHHEDDQLETVLLQLFRGSGLAGIAAMPELALFGKGLLLRPLLTRTRAQLTAWSRANSVEWVEDDTNADEGLDRNYLRRRVVPLIRERWPSVGSSVGRSARHAAEAQRLLDTVALRDVEHAADGNSLLVSSLRALPLERTRNALRFWIARCGYTLPDSRRLAEMCGPLLHARPDANPQVSWSGAVLQRERGRLAIRNSAPAPGDAAFEWRWRASRTFELPDGGQLELRQDPEGSLDLDALPEGLTIRRRAGGERLRLRRGGPSRALKNLLQEAHVPLGERARLPLIWSDERLLAVGDLWCDESVQARPGASRRGRLLWRR